MRRLTLAGVPTGLVATGLAFTGVVGASAAPAHHVHAHASSGNEAFTLTAGPGFKVVAVVHGVVTAAGKDTSKGSTETFHFAGGSFKVHHPDKDAHFVPTINTTTCYASFTETGKYTVSGGTGKYAGISGHGRYTGHGTAVLPRKKNGSCNQDADSPYETFIVKGSGPLSLP